MNNPILILLCAIWISCAIATLGTKDTDCMGAAVVATIAIGIGYFLLHDK